MKYGFIGTFTAIRLLFGFSRVKKDWLKRRGELTSFAFWKDHLGI